MSNNSIYIYDTQGEGVVVNPAVDIEAVRWNFIRYLETGGVMVNAESREFNLKVDECFFYYGDKVKNCSSTNMAVDIWRRTHRRVGTRTRLTVMEVDDVILDGDVPGAESNKAYFEFVLKDGDIFVFKFPQSDDATHAEFIQRDIRFSEFLNSRDIIHPGFVRYRPFQLSKSTGEVIDGSISSYYPLTLNRLEVPLSAKFVFKLISYLLQSARYVHSIDWIIGDIKPENIFMRDKNVFDLGDFGGAVPVHSRLTEFSSEYLPDNLIDELASPQHDLMCLVSTALQLINKKPSGKLTTSSLRVATGLVEDIALKELLISMF